MIIGRELLNSRKGPPGVSLSGVCWGGGDVALQNNLFNVRPNDCHREDGAVCLETYDVFWESICREHDPLKL